MNDITTFYTPGTGLPDFEMRIALGLCAVALQAFEPQKIQLEEIFERYAIKIIGEPHASKEMSKALGWLCQNRLADHSLLHRIPGFRPLHLDKQARNVAKFGKMLSRQDISLLDVFTENNNRKRMGAIDYPCGHENFKDKELFAAILTFSPQLGQPPKRNDASGNMTPPLCPFCGAAGLAGIALSQIDISISSSDRRKKERFFFLPHFRGVINGVVLAQYLAATKHISGRLENIPASSAVFALMALFPHLVDIIGRHVTSIFIGRLDSSGNAPRYGHYQDRSTLTEILFLGEIYNRALIQNCYKMDHRSELLRLLSHSLQNEDEKAFLDFARSYTSASQGKALLPLTATEFFLMEVFKMDKSLLEGDKFKVIKEVADMLQHFVRDRNFGYVDNLRKARDQDEFAKLLLDAQREAQSAVLNPKQQIKPFLPGQNTIQQLLQIVNDGDKQFKSVRTLIAMLAFTYYKKEVQ